MAAKQAFPKAKSEYVFGQTRKTAKMLRAGLYARVSTNDQQTLPMQSRAMREYAARRGWTIAAQVREDPMGFASTLPRAAATRCDTRTDWLRSRHACRRKCSGRTVFARVPLKTSRPPVQNALWGSAWRSDLVLST